MLVIYDMDPASRLDFGDVSHAPGCFGKPARARDSLLSL